MIHSGPVKIDLLGGQLKYTVYVFRKKKKIEGIILDLGGGRDAS